METNFYDKVMDRVNQITNRVSDKIAKRFEKSTPFDKKELTEKDIVGFYDSMTKEDWFEALNNYPIDVVESFRIKAEGIKAKKKR